MILGIFTACIGQETPPHTIIIDPPPIRAWYEQYYFKDTTIRFLVSNGDDLTYELPTRSIWVDPEGDLLLDNIYPYVPY